LKKNTSGIQLSTPYAADMTLTVHYGYSLAIHCSLFDSMGIISDCAIYMHLLLYKFFLLEQKTYNITKWLVHPKIKILSLTPHLDVIPNP
ncbi:MAG: hypothetical protein ACRCZO_01155, partial [Cetobacterium sp.]